jgi:hypothetical protein
LAAGCVPDSFMVPTSCAPPPSARQNDHGIKIFYKNNLEIRKILIILYIFEI